MGFQNVGYFKYGQNLLLNCFDLDKKLNGFFKGTIGENINPEVLSMQSCIFIGSDDCTEVTMEFPIKAKNAGTFIVRRMDAAKSNNYFITNDFKDFKKITDVNPEKNYNWLTAELINWKGFDGKMLQGILYKPENFNVKNKYPIIFHFYVRFSNALN